MKKGFTLFEILIASAIFAMVMVIVTGVIAQMSSYNNKIKLSKNVSEETRKVADQISTDVRQAINEKGTSSNINAVYEADCPPNISSDADYSLCQRRNYMTPSAGFASASSDANTLIITTKDYFIAYYHHLPNKAIYRLVFKNDKVIFPNGIAILPGLRDTFRAITGGALEYEKYRLTRDDTEASVNFAGYTSGGVGAALQQPYVQFYIVSKTIGHDDPAITPSLKAKAELRSMVTSRSYAN